jgi:CubicO group peptidase (beta-lactamase class C family)
MDQRRRLLAGATVVATVTGLLLTLLIVLWPALPGRADTAGGSLPDAGPDGTISSALDPPGPVRVAAPPAPGSLTAEDVTAWLDGFLPARMEAAGIVGGTVAVVADGEVIASRGYGSESVGGEPVDPGETLFRAGSVSKLVTATAAMQLVQDGRVDLDTDIDEYLDIDVPRRFDDPITLRHLLTHTAGFEERVLPFIYERPEDLPSLRDVVAQDPPEQIFRPGTVPAYSNYGMALAGYLVEVVSGQPYEEYVAANILEPLGMADSSVAQPLPEPLAAQMATGYRDGGRTEVPFELVAPAPAGSLSTTADDMARFLLAHLQGGGVDGAEVLDEATAELMQTPALGEDALGTLAGGERMTLGFFEEDRNGRVILGHGGDTLAFHSHLQIYPEEGAGIFVSLNSSGTTGAETLTIRDQLVDGFADRYYPDQASGPPTLETSAEHGAAAEGSYITSRRMQSTFLRALDLQQTTVTAGPDGTLEVSTLTGPDGTPKRWREVEPWVWQEVGGEDRIAMRAQGGRVEAIGFFSAFALTRAPVPATVALPLLLGGAAVLLLTVLAWPATALVRRHYRVAPAGLSVPVRRSRLGARLGAVLVLAALTGWAVVLTTLLQTLAAPPALVVRVLQALTATGLVLLLVAAAWQVWATWRTRVAWTRRIWAVLVLAATVGVVWIALTLGLLSPDITF